MTGTRGSCSDQLELLQGEPRAREERDGSRCCDAGTRQPQPVARPVRLNRVGGAGARLHPSSTTAPLPSSPRQQQAQLSRETRMEKPASRASPQVRDMEHGPRARSITGIKTLHCMGLAFPASLRPFRPLDVVAGKPKQTSLKALPHDKGRPKLCLNASNCREAPPTLLKKTKCRSKTPRSPAEISYSVFLG